MRIHRGGGAGEGVVKCEGLGKKRDGREREPGWCINGGKSYHVTIVSM